jgi:hypothetical protein
VTVQLNRNKRSVVIDLKQEAGVAAVRRLAAGVDVVVENFRPRVADRIGIGYAALSEENPRLVYVAISGFGPDGPYADQPAYDSVIQGLTGFMTFQGTEQEPDLVHAVAADKASGLTAASAVLAALFARERTGRGQRVDVPMLDAYAAFALPDVLGGPTLLRPMLADCAAQHRILRLQCVQNCVQRHRASDLKFNHRVDLRQRPQVRGHHHADHHSTCTSTDNTAGRSRTIGIQLLPSSAEAYTWPPVVPKYTPQGSSVSTVMASRSTLT